MEQSIKQFFVMKAEEKLTIENVRSLEDYTLDVELIFIFNLC